MRRKFFLAFFLFTVLCVLSGCFAKNAFEKGWSIAPFTKTHGPILQKIESATVFFQNDKKRWSGIAISPDGRVLTAWHGLNVRNIDVSNLSSVAHVYVKKELASGLMGLLLKEIVEGP